MTLPTEQLVLWAEQYNDPVYFEEDPVSFVREFDRKRRAGKASGQDVEIAALLASHLAWGRRSMIVRDCGRLFAQMDGRPYDYVMRGRYRSGNDSIHRTVKWDDIALICGNLREAYLSGTTLEPMSVLNIRTGIFGQKDDPRAACKKISLMRRWLTRNDGKVDIGLWKDTDPASLTIPLDVHVHRMATEIGITARKQKDYNCAREITDFFAEIFPGDPCKGDFALFGYGVTHQGERIDP